MIRSIAHPTDLSPECLPAFEHALRLALLNRSELNLVHIAEPGENGGWDGFPHVRETMARWHFIRPDAEQHDVLSQTGVSVSKFRVHTDDVISGLARFLEERSTDLLVMASRGRAGIDALLGGSLAAELAHTTKLTTLIVGPAARSFVDPDTGSHEALKTVLVAVDHNPPPHFAIRRLNVLAKDLDVEFDYVHVGSKAPVVLGEDGRMRHVRTLDGPVVETLLAEADRADLIAMPMRGRDGFLDALRGSTTERIVREASVPVLALPV